MAYRSLHQSDFDSFKVYVAVILFSHGLVGLLCNKAEIFDLAVVMVMFCSIRISRFFADPCSSSTASRSTSKHSVLLHTTHASNLLLSVRTRFSTASRSKISASVRKKQYSYIYFEKSNTLMETTVRHACIPLL